MVPNFLTDLADLVIGENGCNGNCHEIGAKVGNLTLIFKESIETKVIQKQN